MKRLHTEVVRCQSLFGLGGSICWAACVRVVVRVCFGPWCLHSTYSCNPSAIQRRKWCSWS